MASWIGPAVTAAFISSLIAAIGWCVGRRTTLDAEGRHRKERVRDVQSALLAEIRSVLHHREQYASKTIMDAVQAQLATDSSYMPTIPREPGSPLFGAIVEEISILPNAVIDQVVLFYRQQEVISHFADDLRGGLLAGKSPGKKLDMIGDYLALRDAGARLGTDAAEALQTSLALRPSKPDEDRLDLESASKAGGA